MCAWLKHACGQHMRRWAKGVRGPANAPWSYSWLGRALARCASNGHSRGAQHCTRMHLPQSKLPPLSATHRTTPHHASLRMHRTASRPTATHSNAPRLIAPHSNAPHHITPHRERVQHSVELQLLRLLQPIARLQCLGPQGSLRAHTSISSTCTQEHRLRACHGDRDAQEQGLTTGDAATSGWWHALHGRQVFQQAQRQGSHAIRSLLAARTEGTPATPLLQSKYVLYRGLFEPHTRGNIPEALVCTMWPV